MKMMFRFSMFALLVALFLVSPVRTVAAPDTKAMSDSAATNAVDDVDWARHVVEAYKSFEQHQHETVSVLERTRQEAAAAAAAAASTSAQMEARMKRLETTLLADRDWQMRALEDSHRFTLKVVGAIAITGFVGMLIIALFLLRVMSRRVRVATSTLAPRPASEALPSAEQDLVALNPAEQSSARFLSAIERLEKRIAEMETDATLTDILPGETTVTVAPAADTQAANVTLKEPDHVAVLIGKGQSHLNLGQFDEALACFEEAITLDPDNADAHVRKGSALEGKDQIDQALAQYNRAIELDQTLTTAYLRKGGVYNRLERYGEALQCYEQALRTQQKAHLTPFHA